MLGFNHLFLCLMVSGYTVWCFFFLFFYFNLCQPLLSSRIVLTLTDNCVIITPDGVCKCHIWTEGVHGPELWLHVQNPHHWKQQCRKDFVPFPLCRWLIHTSLCQHSGHRLQGQDHLQEWQEDKTADLGENVDTYSTFLQTCWGCWLSASSQSSLRCFGKWREMCGKIFRETDALLWLMFYSELQHTLGIRNKNSPWWLFVFVVKAKTLATTLFSVWFFLFHNCIVLKHLFQFPTMWGRI